MIQSLQNLPWEPAGSDYTGQLKKKLLIIYKATSFSNE
jgi:hypothetical protein